MAQTGAFCERESKGPGKVSRLVGIDPATGAAVFVGEVDEGKVVEFHTWIQFILRSALAVPIT